MGDVKVPTGAIDSEDEKLERRLKALQREPRQSALKKPRVVRSRDKFQDQDLESTLYRDLDLTLPPPDPPSQDFTVPDANMEAMLAEQEAKLERMTKAIADRRKAKAAAAAKSTAEVEKRAATEEAAANPTYLKMAARVAALQQRFNAVESDIRSMAEVLHILLNDFVIKYRQCISNSCLYILGVVGRGKRGPCQSSTAQLSSATYTAPTATDTAATMATARTTGRPPAPAGSLCSDQCLASYRRKVFV